MNCRRASIVSADALLFQKICIGGEVSGGEVRGVNHRHYRELLYALERARSRLAVAIAVENKITPRERWRRYLETEDRMRKCLREIRRHPNLVSFGQFGWLQALDLLRLPLPGADPTAQGEAQLLCQRLHTILDLIENRDK